MITELVGWAGSIMLAACGIPLVYASLRDRSIAKNISMSFLQLWGWGEVFVILYAAMREVPLTPVLFNCSINIICILIILWIRWRNLADD